MGIQAGIADRLSSTLFVAALAHGIVILGITFTTDPSPTNDSLAPLNVTLLLDAPTNPSDARHDLLAERSHDGAGRPEDGARPTRTLTADHPVARLGEPLGADSLAGTPLERARVPEQLVTRNPADERVDVVPDTTETPTTAPMRAATLIPDTAPRMLAAELDVTAVLPKSESAAADVSSPSTSESVLAEYLVGWRQRVERIGTANFPQRFLERGRDFGRPTLEVVIGPQGNLEEIVVRRSSGDVALDQAALKILRMAAPFEPLPPSITTEFRVLRFAYEWDFSTGDRAPTTPRL